MLNGQYRLGIVGASSLLGKELADVVSESVLGASTLILLDDEELAGQMTVAGDEAAVIQKLDPNSFDGMDFVFFTGSAEVTRAQWKAARQAGASLIDLTHALEGEKDIVVRAAWVEEALNVAGRAVPQPSPKIDLGTQAVVAANPASLMLALLGARLTGDVRAVSLAATVMEPASEHGGAAMDELHRQTVNLLSFQTLPKEQHDAQVAFNLLPGLGESARIASAAKRRRIAGQYAAVGAGRLPELSVQVVHAPVFHGYACSIVVDLAEPVTVEQVEAALAGAHTDLVAEGSDPPSNLSVAGQDNILFQVREAYQGERGTRFWVWMAGDNLRLAALNAVACALELRQLRPRGKVQ